MKEGRRTSLSQSQSRRRRSSLNAARKENPPSRLPVSARRPGPAKLKQESEGLRGQRLRLPNGLIQSRREETRRESKGSSRRSGSGRAEGWDGRMGLSDHPSPTIGDTREADHTGGRAHGRRVVAAAASRGTPCMGARAPPPVFLEREARQSRRPSPTGGARAPVVLDLSLAGLTRASPSPPQDQCNASDKARTAEIHAAAGVRRLPEMARREHVVLDC